MEATLQGVTSQEELRARNLDQVLQQQLAQTVLQVLQRNIGLRQAAALQEATAEDTILADSSVQAKLTLLEVRKEVQEVPSEEDRDKDDEDWAKADREQIIGGRPRSRSYKALWGVRRAQL